MSWGGARKVLIGFSALALVAVALGAGVALGSSASQAQQAPPPKSVGADGQSTSIQSGKSTKEIEPKSQAYVHWLADGAIVGDSKDVIAVHHPSAGYYCVELRNSLHVTVNTFANMTIDYVNTPTYFTLVPEAYPVDGGCLASGFANSVGVLTLESDTIPPALADASVFFTIP